MNQGLHFAYLLNEDIQTRFLEWGYMYRFSAFFFILAFVSILTTAFHSFDFSNQTMSLVTSFFMIFAVILFLISLLRSSKDSFYLP